ncbi:MAG TPA: hypothetical protein VGF59_00045 [Bryobacteraceae bacterium]|jgi:hypothetical protein
MNDQADDQADAGGRRADGQWLAYADAAARLGVSAEAVRKRAQRGTLPSNRRDGRTYVWVASADRAGVRADASGTNDRPQAGAGRMRADASSGSPVAALESEVAYLRQLLDAEVEARRRADLLNAALLERLPKLAAGEAAAEPPVTQNKGPGRAESSPPPSDVSESIWARLRRWVTGE